MANKDTFAQRTRLAQETRERFLAEVGASMEELGAAIQEHLTTLINERLPARELQTRRDAWTLYQTRRSAWIEGTLKDWQATLKPPVVLPKKEEPDETLELLGTEVVENKIVASRLVLSVMEKVSAEFNDLSVRIKFLEGLEELAGNDIFRPEVLVLLMIEQWAIAGMPRDAWSTVNDVARKLLTQRINQAYANANAILVKKGVLPTIELKDRVKRVGSGASRAGRSSGSRVAGQSPGQAPPEDGSGADSGLADHYGDSQDRDGYRGDGMQAGPGYWVQGSAVRVPASGGYLVPGGAAGPRRSSSGARNPAHGGAPGEMRTMVPAGSVGRARSRAQGVLVQLRHLLIGPDEADIDATQPQAPSSALAAAIAVRPSYGGHGRGGGVVVEDDGPDGLVQAAGEIRRASAELKNKAVTKNEKATIEIVALMFQAILQESRIPPGIRVWFSRLQMPVLRVALAEPDFFGTLSHPARALIDRMGSCVMGFDASGISGSALETEIKRIVQVVEQYPETGRRVFQLVYDEFQAFLTKFLTGNESSQKVVGMAQQIEQKETLRIQYTIEMRSLLEHMPVRDQIREFLFNVWAEVLAIAAVRHGPQHEETLSFKTLASDLVWAASAKPNRSDRARVIADLPRLLQKLRAGMGLLGLAPSEQQDHIKAISETLAQAFRSKTQAIAPEQIAVMAEHLEHLEDFVSEDPMGDFPLDAQSVEMLAGLDSSMIEVIADGGSKPSAEMLVWAQELQVGCWLMLDHNGHLAQVQFVWRSAGAHLHLFASIDGRSYLMQTGRLAAYLQAGLLVPQEEETLTVRASRDALAKLEANPERLLT